MVSGYGSSGDSTAICVKNIGSATQSEITHILGTFGHIESVNIVSPANSSPMALVTFSDPQNAHAAIHSTDLKTKEGNKLVMSLSGAATSDSSASSKNPYSSTASSNPYSSGMPSSSSNNQINYASGSGEESYHVYVGDIGPEVDNAKLKQVFAEFGNITQSKVIKDTSTQTSKGYGFVTFSCREEAEKAIAQKNGSWLGFNLIKCNWATRKPTNTNRSLKYDEVYKMASQNNTTAYIGNLDINISQEAIRNLCSKQGKIVDLKLYNEKGYGFAKYATKDEACRAIVNIHGSKINNTTLKASWGKEDSVLSSQMIDYNLAQSLSTATGMGMSSGADPSNMYMAQQQPYNQNAMSVNPYNSQYVQQSALPYSMPHGQSGAGQNLSANHSNSPQSAANSSANASQQQALALQQMYMMMYQQQLYNNQVAAASGGTTAATPGSNTAGQQAAGAAANNPALTSALMAQNQGNMGQLSAYGAQQQVGAGSNTSPYWNIPKST